MKYGTVSVVLPVFNAGAYFCDAISSVCNQSFKNLEIIVINDGSTDSTRDQIQKVNVEDERVRVVDRRDNCGLVYSLNEGLSLCSGTYIARMDADDISLSYRIARQVRFLEAANLDVIGCDYSVINERGELQRTVCVPRTTEMISLKLCGGTPFAHGSVLMRTSALEGFSYTEGAVEDYALWSKLFSSGVRLGNVPQSLYLLRKHPDSFSKKKRRDMQVASYTIGFQHTRCNLKTIEKIFSEQLQKNKWTEEEKRILLVAAIMRLRLESANFGNCLLVFLRSTSQFRFLLGQIKRILETWFRIRFQGNKVRSK